MQYCSLKSLDAFFVVYRIGGRNVARTKRKVAHLALDATRNLAPAARHDPFFPKLVEPRLIKFFSLVRGGLGPKGEVCAGQPAQRAGTRAGPDLLGPSAPLRT